VRGPDDTPYTGGYYHGKLVFPREFPFKPPSIYMITPSGRFKCNQRLCLSISDFHPDTWNPAWSVTTILTGLLSFMVEDTPTLGSVETSVHTKQNLAMCSRTYNLKNTVFCELFPDIVTEIKSKIAEINQDRKNDATENQGGKSADSGEFVQYRRDDEDANRSISNIAIIIGVAAFGFVVNSIIKSI